MQIRNRLRDLGPLEQATLKSMREGDVTVAYLARRIDRSLPSTKAVLRRLMNAGWVDEKGVADSTGGRRPTLYGMRTGAGWLLGVDAGRRSTRLLALGMKGDVLAARTFRSPDLHEADEAVDLITDWVREFLRDNALPRETALGAGFALPGLVDNRSGESLTYLTTRRPLAEVLSDRFELPTAIYNDARAMAFGEFAYGAAKGAENALVVNMGWGGVGMGIIAGGKLYFGAHRHAGELGHISMDPDGELCDCGKRGCLETLCSGRAMVRKVVRRMKSGKASRIQEMVHGDLDAIDTGVLVEAVLRGDPLAVDALLEAANTLGRGLAILITLFDPDLIVVGGYVSAVGSILIDALRTSARAYTIPQLFEDVPIVVSTLGDHAAAIGAASLMLERLFAGEERPEEKRMKKNARA